MLDPIAGEPTPEVIRNRPTRELNRQTRRSRRQQRAYRRGEPVPTPSGKLQVRTPGGARTVSPEQYRRLIEAALESGRQREASARRYGFSSIGAQNRANQARPGLAGRFSGAGGGLQVAGLSTEGVKRFYNDDTLIGAALSKPVRDEAKHFATATGKDLVSLPANVVLGTYYMGKAGVKAAAGDSSEAKQLWRDYKETDPIALAAQGRFVESMEQVREHPLLAGLTVYGAGAVASRGLARAGGMERRRSPRSVPGTNIVQNRQYRPGLVGKAGQRGREGWRRRSRDRLNLRAAEAEAAGHADRAADLRRQAARKDPDRLPEQEIQRRVDLLEGQNQSMRRPGRAETARAARAALASVPKGQRHAVSLVAQRIAHADPDDLRSYLTALEAEFPKLSSSKKNANKQMRKQVEKALVGDLDPVAVERAVADYVGVAKPLERELVEAGMLEPGEATKAKLIPYAVRRMGAERIEGVGIVAASKVDDARAAVSELRSARGRAAKSPTKENRAAVRAAEADVSRAVLAPAEIERHMRANGIDPEQTAFVTHAPGALGDGAFNVSARQAPGIPQRARSGESVRQGLLDVDPERMVEQAVQMRGLADANRSWRRFVGEMFAKDRSGKTVALPKAEAQRVAKDMMFDENGDPVPGAYAWRVVPLNPWRGRQAQLRSLLDEADDEGFVLDDEGARRHPISEALEAALKGEGEHEGPYGLVPDVAARRLAEHAAVVRTTGPGMRAVTQAFRKTVLPTSTSWLTGNAAEAALRTAVDRAGPRSWVTYRRVYNELALGDSSIGRALMPRQARRSGERLPHPFRLPDSKPGSDAERLLHMTPGGHYGGTNDTMIRVSANQFENTKLEGVARAVKALGEKPGPGTLARAYGRYADWMMGTVNAALEAQFTRTAGGAHMRRVLMNRRERRNMESAVEQAARGIRGSGAQVAMADDVRRVIGQYDSFSPAARKWLLTYTPFGAWAFNALKFLYVTMPKDHPGLVALAAVNHQLSEDWREEKGLDQWAADAVPDFLQGSIPLPGGGHLRAARYTPFGLATNPLETIASTVLPQLMGPLMTFRGLDWKGAPIRNSEGDQETDPYKLAAIAAREFAFATVPIIGLASRVREKGPSALNPLNPVAPSGKGAGGGSGAPKTAEEVLERLKDQAGPAPTAEQVLEKIAR
jgi:hypothetical protein